MLAGNDPKWMMMVTLLVAILGVFGTVRSFTISPGYPRNSRPACLWAATAPTSDTADDATVTNDVILPGDSFRSTSLGELSVVSCNVLAPTYHGLALEDLEERQRFCEKDRKERFPEAVRMAKQSNADILLLQEVEGGGTLEPQLRKILRESISDTIPGYDSCLWVPLLPNKSDHVVGLCVAWRSNRHKLVATEGYKRGMACLFSEIGKEGEMGSFGVANVHLPARPSNIMGRLVTMSKTIQRLANYDVLERKSPLDGLLVIGGDWNCDHHSVAAKLLKDGKVHYGNVRDRNYKANISKPVASRMRHGYRFQDAYSDELREHHAPVTVSLHGRGPGTMDHIFYAQAERGPSKTFHDNTPKVVKLNNNQKGRMPMSKRKSRREKATRMRRADRGPGSSRGSNKGNVRVESVLATVAGKHDTKRLDIINQGIPNVKAGFPSDHLPVGVLFAPRPDFFLTDERYEDAMDESNQEQVLSNSFGVGGVTSNVRRRREAGLESLSTRRRHNLVLRCIAEWLEDGGATEIIRDQPLYKNSWTKDAKDLTKKSRAPDIVCRIHDTLVVVEVTVVASAKVEVIAKQKQDKYMDLQEVLSYNAAIQDARLKVSLPQIVVLDESGRIPDLTRDAIYHLASLLHPDDGDAAEAGTQKCHNRLLNLF